MITLPTALQKSYVKRVVRHMQQRPMIEIVSSQLVILLSLCYI